MGGTVYRLSYFFFFFPSFVVLVFYLPFFCAVCVLNLLFMECQKRCLRVFFVFVTFYYFFLSFFVFSVSLPCIFSCFLSLNFFFLSLPSFFCTFPHHPFFIFSSSFPSKFLLFLSYLCRCNLSPNLLTFPYILSC